MPSQRLIDRTHKISKLTYSWSIGPLQEPLILAPLSRILGLLAFDILLAAAHVMSSGSYRICDFYAMCPSLQQIIFVAPSSTKFAVWVRTTRLYLVLTNLLRSSMPLWFWHHTIYLFNLVFSLLEASTTINLVTKVDVTPFWVKPILHLQVSNSSVWTSVVVCQIRKTIGISSRNI